MYNKIRSVVKKLNGLISSRGGIGIRARLRI